MNRTALIGLLALSLIFNVFFVIGAMSQSPEQVSQRRFQQMARELDLDPRQSDRLIELRKSLADQNAVLKEDIRRIRAQIAQELDRTTPDLELVRSLIEQEAAFTATCRASAAQHCGDFIDLLTPEQRHALGRRLAKKRHARKMPPEVMSRFDNDGDGRLNKEEHARARAEMGRRHERMRHLREQARDRFDANEDGTLDANEREAMRGWLLEQGFELPEGMNTPQGRQNDKERPGRHKKGHRDHRERNSQMAPADPPPTSEQPL